MIDPEIQKQLDDLRKQIDVAKKQDFSVEPVNHPSTVVNLLQAVQVPYTTILPTYSPNYNQEVIYRTGSTYFYYVYANGGWRSQQLGGGGSGSPGGSNNELQFNDSGSFGGTTFIEYSASVPSFSSPGIVSQTATNTDDPGSSFGIAAGDGNGIGDGGNIGIKGGEGGITNGAGGGVTVIGGSSTNSVGGDVFIEPGMGITNQGDVFLGATGPISTTATTGFLLIPYSSGTMTSLPAGIFKGNYIPIIYDKTNNKLLAYNSNSSSWKSVTLT